MATELLLDRFTFPVAGDLQTLVSRLSGHTSSSAPQPLWSEAIVRIATSLQVEPELIAPFVAAWRALYTVTLCLDHLQDGDALGDPWLEALPTSLQYHAAFSVYIAAQHALAQLDARAIPATRIMRLQRFWATSVAQLANGQYRDLTVTLARLQAQGVPPLDAYEQIAVQKTGATFALAFGGIAILATDDEAVIAALTTAGTVYGMLLQYQDDLLDGAEQEARPATTTLSRALLATHPTLAAHGAGAVETFWAAIYASYTQAIERILTPLSAETRDAYVELLRRSFTAPAVRVEMN